MESNTPDSNSFLWTDVNWAALRKLRARFLQFDPRETPSVEPDRADYWRSHSELASYDFTFAERIGWKWDTVLAELTTRGWTPPQGTVLDWGCGTGVAGRRVVDAWRDQVRSLLLSDRSAPAQQFAAARAGGLSRSAGARSSDRCGAGFIGDQPCNQRADPGGAGTALGVGG